jgi:pseudouridine-5'-phosphate glycosidase
MLSIMSAESAIEVRPEIAGAIRARQAVVALESTLVTHGLPHPVNLETARLTEQAVRDEAAIPATIGVLNGTPTVGLTDSEIARLATGGAIKASRRDLALAMVRGIDAGTTVAATMHLAHRAGIEVFATGGIGGVHPGTRFDVSADLIELSRTPVAVVCAGAKSILDLPRTLEVLESLGVPVIGYGTEWFPAFVVRESRVRVPCRIDSPEDAAAIITAHFRLGGGGIVVAQPIAGEFAIDAAEFERADAEAQRLAESQNIHGTDLTPFLLGAIGRITHGRTIEANRQLIIANARLAAQLARAIHGLAAS